MLENPFVGAYIQTSAMTLCGQDLTEIGDSFNNICHTREADTERRMTRIPREPYNEHLRGATTSKDWELWHSVGGDAGLRRRVARPRTARRV